MSEEIKRGRGNPNFHKGMKSANPDGRPAGSGSQMKRSKLRAIESNLLKLTKKSMENIEKSVEGLPVDKEVLNTSKWVVATAMVANKAALAEEIQINGLSANSAKEEIQEIQSESSSTRFSLDMLDDEVSEEIKVPYNFENLPTQRNLQ